MNYGMRWVERMLPIVLCLSLVMVGCARAPVIETVQSTAVPSPLYKDASAPMEARVEDLMSRMTLPEKIGQMTQVEKNSIAPQDVTRYFIGSILSGGGGSPAVNSTEEWAKMVDAFQERALKTRLGIPMIYGVDAVHGHNNLRGAVIFPQNVGLGATRDPELVQRIGRATAEEMAATGIHWDFAPVVAVPQDIRWGRTYEGYSEKTEVVTSLSTAFIKGLQGPTLNDPLSALATAKHYAGDGGTAWGSSTTNGYKIDQGITEVDEVTLRAIHLPPYQAAVRAGALSVMASFSSWGGKKMNAQKYLLTDVLKGEYAFRGFIVSDWGAIDQISSDYYTAVVTAINAGVDMNMVPSDYVRFIDTMNAAVEKGDISMARIDDAVRRILAVKFKLGLFERPYADPALASLVGSEEHRALAREAVAKSLVLLQNARQTLPISKDTGMIFVAGQAADDLGLMCGGWTITWQGQPGSITEGTTILDAIKATIGAESKVEYNRFAKFDRVFDASGKPAIAEVGIVVTGEIPYAEGEGDQADLRLSEPDNALITQLRGRVNKLVVILISGRPLVITAQLPNIDALVAAWLPGTEGQGVADVLFGDKPFTGKLPYTWPRNIEQLPFDFAHLETGEKGPLYPFGYGLEK